MPVYDYDCAACGRRFEVIHGVHVDGPTTCPLCGKGPVRKAISAPAIHYKGSGWAKKERRATASPGSARTGDDSPSSDEPASSDAPSESTPKTEASPATTGKDAGSKPAAPKTAASNKTTPTAD